MEKEPHPNYVPNVVLEEDENYDPQVEASDLQNQTNKDFSFFDSNGDNQEEAKNEVVEAGKPLPADSFPSLFKK